MRRLLLLLALALTGCGAAKRLPVESKVDSVSVVIVETVTYKDSLIYVEVPTEQSSAVLPDTDTSRLETSLARSEAWVADNQLHHTLSHKEDVRIPKIISLPSYARTEEKAALSREVVVKEVEKDLTAWQSFRMTLGTILLILLSVWLMGKAWKIFS